MKPNTLDECLDYCREAAREGDDYDTIKAEVLRWDLEPGLRKKILLKADDYVYQYIMAKQQREKAVNRMLIGGVLLGRRPGRGLRFLLRHEGRIPHPFRCHLHRRLAAQRGL